MSRISQNRRGRFGFTLIEVLVTLALLAIVMPAIMKGITMASTAASDARRRNEAAGLAQAKLQEIVAGQSYSNGNLSGDFSPNWPAYQWHATVQAWPDDINGTGLEEIDLTVNWTARGRPSQIMLSTLVLPSAQQ